MSSVKLTQASRLSHFVPRSTMSGTTNLVSITLIFPYFNKGIPSQMSTKVAKVANNGCLNKKNLNWLYIIDCTPKWLHVIYILAKREMAKKIYLQSEIFGFGICFAISIYYKNLLTSSLTNWKLTNLILSITRMMMRPHEAHLRARSHHECFVGVY